MNKSFIKNILKVSSGTVLAQIIVFSAYPIITRLYTPDSFGVLASFMSILSILSVICALRLEVAIPLPKNNKVAFYLILVSIAILIAFTIILYIIIMLFGNHLLKLSNLNEVIPYMYLIPLGVSLIGLYQIFSYWVIRNKQFIVLSKSKISQSFSLILAQVLFGFMGLKTLGLIIGDILGRSNGIGMMFLSSKKGLSRYIKSKIDLRKMIVVLRRYRKFPLISAPSSLLNSIGTHVSPILILSFYGTQITGSFSLAQKVVAIPMMFIGQAVSQVYYSEISTLLNEGKAKEIKILFNKILKRLFLISILPTGILLFYSPKIFHIIFGGNWVVSGEFVQIMSIMLLAQFTIVPLSQTFYTLEKQNLLLLWDIFRTILVVTSIVLPSILGLSAMNMVMIYSIMMLISYIIMLILLKKIINQL